MQVDGTWSCAIGTYSAGPPPALLTSTPASRPVKLVTITVRDGSATGQLLFTRELDLRLLDRLTTHFDPRNQTWLHSHTTQSTRRGSRSPVSFTRPTSARRASSCRCAGSCRSALDERGAAGGRRAGGAFKKVKPKSLQVFARQFATMIAAGVSVVAALVTLEEQTDDKYLAEVIADVRSEIEGGVILSKALARHPKVFNRLFVAMVEAGESSGTLDTVLDRVAVADREGDADQATRQGRDGLPGGRDHVRVPRAHVHAPLHHPGLRGRLRPAARRAAEAHPDRDADVVRAPPLVVRHLPRDRRDRSSRSAA